MELHNCRRCGATLTQQTASSYRCANDHVIFYNPLPTTGVFIVTEDNQVMLSVRGIEPHKGMLDSFGGFVDGAETLEQGLERELHEELGLTTNDYETPTFLCSAIGHYAYGGETLTVLSSLFYTRLKPGVTPVPADDVAAIETHDIATLDLSRLHDDDVRAGMRALRAALKLDVV